MPKSNSNGHVPTITSVSAWLEDYDIITLPSGKVVGLRPVDMLSLILEDGSAPNFLIQFVQGHMENVPMNAQGQPEMDVKEMRDLLTLLNKVARVCFADPIIVDDMEAVQRGEGILLSMISLEDKMALLPWGMGGQSAVDSASRFFEQQKPDPEPVLSSLSVQPSTEPSAEDTE